MIAYRHLNDEIFKGTFALELPLKEHLNQLFNMHANQFAMIVGLSKVHPHDNFSRNVGREISRQLMQPTIVDFRQVEIRGIKHIYHFSYQCPRKGIVAFGVSTIKETDEIKLTYVEVIN